MKKSYFIVAVLILSVCSQCRAQKDPGGEQEIYLNHIALFVDDLRESTAFYENILGLKQIPEPFNDGRHTWFTLGVAGQIHLIQSVDNEIKRNKHDHVCFSVRSVEAFVKKLNDNKIAFSNWAGDPQAITTRVDGVKQIFFQDPDGHWIEVNDDFPSEK
jgi:lactoylglutathione lyase